MYNAYPTGVNNWSVALTTVHEWLDDVANANVAPAWTQAEAVSNGLCLM